MNQAASQSRTTIVTLNAEGIEQFIPHRGKALCINNAAYDSSQPGKILTSTHLSANQHYFEGHYPGRPTLSAHWQLEMISISGALLMKLRYPELKGFPFMSAMGEKHEFLHSIIPPQRIEIITKIAGIGYRRGEILICFDGEIYLKSSRLATSVKNFSGIIQTQR